jgi:hypothetical protein
MGYSVQSQPTTRRFPMMTIPNQETEAEVLGRAEKMLREMLAAQIRQGVIEPGGRFDKAELRRQLNDCRTAAIHAIRWEQAHPGQQWLPSFTDANRADGLSERRYRQYAPPTSKDM